MSDWAPHATVATVIERGGTYLMVEERDKQTGEMVFNQPAGHLEDDESLLDAVCREVLEETAYEFTPQSLLGCYRWRHPQQGHTHMRMAFCGDVARHPTTRDLDPDIVATHWMSYDEIAASEALRSPLVLQCLDDFITGQRHSLLLLKDVR